MLTRTTSTLLDALIDPHNNAVWMEFDARYRPVIHAFARRLGLSGEDAADAAQETLVRFVYAYRDGAYDRTRGRLHSWIIGIARNCVSESQRARRTRRELRGLSAIGVIPDDDALERLWNEELDRVILTRGLERLRLETGAEPRTLRAFEMLALGEQSVADVAGALGMSRNDVYLAKHRCLKRLREFVREQDDAFDLR